MSEHPTAVSEVFSQEMMTLMRLEGCITGAKDKECINMIVVRSKVADEEISIELFNQLLKQDCLFKVESKNHKLD